MNDLLILLLVVVVLTTTVTTTFVLACLFIDILLPDRDGFIRIYFYVLLVILTDALDCKHCNNKTHRLYDSDYRYLISPLMPIFLLVALFIMVCFHFP